MRGGGETTGARLFALALEPAPGWRGVLACGDAAVPLRDPVRIEFRNRDERLEVGVESLARTPGDTRMHWRAGALAIDEAKLVTEDDRVVVELACTNRGESALDFELCASSGAAVEFERFSTRQVALDLSSAATFAASSGAALGIAAAAPSLVFVEGELPTSGASSARVLSLRDASAGRALDGFGVQAGERLEWDVLVPPLAAPELVLRVSNAGTETAAVHVELDGARAASLAIPPQTRESAWTFARAPLAGLRAGRHRVALVCGERTAWLRLDGFFVGERDVVPPALSPGGAWPPPATAELELPFGELVLDRVRYRLPAPGPDARPTVIALRGGSDGERARELPERATFTLEPRARAVETLHVLVAAVTPRRAAADASRSAPEAPAGARADASCASVTVRLDDGSAETFAWPALARSAPSAPSAPSTPGTIAPGARDRCEWRAVSFAAPPEVAGAWQFSYVAPPGRFVRALEFVSSGGERVPVVLAATLELPRDTGRLPVLVGRATLDGTPLEIALALEDGVLAHAPDGARELRASAHLEPGERLVRRAVLALGTRDLPTASAALDSARDAKLVEHALADRDRWYAEHVPSFAASDPTLAAAWSAGWRVVRANVLRLDLPDFSLPVAYEGTCCAAHARVSPAALTLALRELRWLTGVPAAQGSLRALLKRAAPDGTLAPQSPSARGAVEPHDLAAAALELYAADGSTQCLKEVLDLLERDFFASLARLDPGATLAFAEADARESGLPGRPAFESVRPGERVVPAELGARLWRDASALAEGHRVLGEDAAAQRLDEFALRLAQRTMERAWSDEQRWFVSTRVDGAPLAAREIAGILPLATGLAPLRPPYTSAFAALDADAASGGFRSAFGVRSAPRPARPERPERASDPLGWNGPVRPEAVTWTLDALARALRENAPGVELETFERVFAAYAERVARGGPREAYDPDTGAGAGCSGVLRAPFADLVIRYVAGLVPRTDGKLEVRPLLRGLEWFRCARIPYHGRFVDVTWDRPDGRVARPEFGVEEGFTVAIDGAPVFHSRELEPFVQR